MSHTISSYCDLDLCPSFNNNSVRSIYLILFEIGIPNLVCECILGWWNVLYHLRVTVALTYDLVFRKSCHEHISFIIKGRNPKFGVWVQFFNFECHILFLGLFGRDL